MVRSMSAHAAAALFASAAWGATYTVTTNANGGVGSLRWAIGRANTHAGPDRIVFAPGLSGKTIAPTGPLPTVGDDRTRILGDTNNDGATCQAIAPLRMSR